MIDVAPFSVAMTILSSTARDPLEKLSNSKTPTGPFQRMVLAFSMTTLKAAMVSSPTSRPNHPSSIPELTVATPV